MQPLVLVVAALCFSQLTSSIPIETSPLTEEIWRYYQFKEQFNKSQNGLELEQKRYAAFQANLATIDAFNSAALNASYKQGLNQLSDLSQKEFLVTMTIQNASLIRTQTLNAGNISWLNLDNFEAPPYIDYSANSHRRVGHVQDQGPCASGWAFATTGLLEGLEIKNRTHNVIPLSAQNILDCDHYDSGCRGGDVETALKSIREIGGLNTEQVYPYEANNETFQCRYNKYDPFVITMYLRNSTNLPRGDEDTLKKVVAKYGPVAVALDASPASFRNYKLGVYSDSDCKQDKLNHHMLVVGYGTTSDGQDYWKLKNSWSRSWGMSGYMMLARNKQNHCGVASKATIVQISN